MTQTELSVGIHGAGGRMGTRLVQLIADDPGLKLGAALDRAGHPRLGEDAGTLAAVSPLGVPLSSRCPRIASSTSSSTFRCRRARSRSRACADRKIPLVVGTTGFDPASARNSRAAPKVIPILIAPNMSRAVNLLMRLVRRGCPHARPGSRYRHHRTPSSHQERRSQRHRASHWPISPSRAWLPLPAGAAGQSNSEISMHSLRVADSPGEHTVVFAVPGETIELGHRALNRDGFARGALDAARFLAGKPPGLYSIDDVLGC